MTSVATTVATGCMHLQRCGSLILQNRFDFHLSCAAQAVESFFQLR